MLREQTAEEARFVSGLVEAVRLDGIHSLRDEALLDLLAVVRGSLGPFARLRAAAILVGLARRIEHSAEDYPNLVRAAADLADDHEGDERERALHASRTIIRPLADAYMKEA